MRTKLALLALCFGITSHAADLQILQLPLTLSGSGRFVWTNAVWWTNSPPPTNIETWQAWWAVSTNLDRITNVIGHAKTVTNAGGYYWFDPNGDIVAASIIVNPGPPRIKLNNDGSAWFVSGYVMADVDGMFTANGYYGASYGAAQFPAGLVGSAEQLTNATPSLFPATNYPSPGHALRWNGSQFYWGP